MLETLPQWSWNPFEDQWNEGFEYLKKYIEENGHSRVPQNLNYEGYLLGKWVSHQRNGKNKLSAKKIELFEKVPGWSWNLFEEQWNKGFEYLKKYFEEQGHARVSSTVKYQNFNLVTVQK